MTTTETAPAHALDELGQHEATVSSRMPADPDPTLPTPGDVDDLTMGCRLADFALTKLRYWVEGESGEVSTSLLELACRIGELYVAAANAQMRRDMFTAARNDAAQAEAAAQRQLEATGNHLADDLDATQAEAPQQFPLDAAEDAIEAAE